MVRHAFSLQIVRISSSAWAAVSAQMTRPPLFGKDGFEILQLFVQGFDGPPFDILGPFACEVQIGKLLLTLRYHCVIAADIEIDLFAVVKILRFDRAAGDEVSCGFCHGKSGLNNFLRFARGRYRSPSHIFG